MTEAGLAPAVAMSLVIVYTTPAEKMVTIDLLVLAAVAVAVLVIRRRGSTDGSHSTWNQPISKIQIAQRQLSEY